MASMALIPAAVWARDGVVPLRPTVLGRVSATALAYRTAWPVSSGAHRVPSQTSHLDHGKT
jgi:hypothetical protein